MKNLNFLMALATLITFSNPANAFICGKKCQAKKAKAKEHLENGGNCTDLKGGTKRKCKRQARKIARTEAKEHCKGRGAACRRTMRRDAKGRMGAYGFIGAKKANAQSKDNWKLYAERKAELDQLLSTNQITQDQYNQFLKEAETMRRKESNRIGRVKTVKTVAAVGIAAATVATAGVAGVAAAGATSTGIATNVAVSAAGVTTIYGSTGAAILGTAGGALAATGGTALAGAGAMIGAGASNGYGRRATDQINYRKKLFVAQQANQIENQTNLPGIDEASDRYIASIGGQCASFAPGSCERKKCNCEIGFKRGIQGQQVKRVNNRDGEHTVRYLCSQKLEDGLKGAWLHAVSQRPEIGKGCM